MPHHTHRELTALLVDFSIATAAGITADFVKRLLDKRDDHSDSEPDEPVDREDAPTPARVCPGKTY
ncbi:hypothetical protein SHJG_1370 [Streptomyces hygroscopicus subsp. jinggangensis 5008]|nr:hypothetical protein SHJG_1370 [Streptomyces hygroscopicus subsp. jinggangensis 5008]AGF60870.1 hypothetical protein SHJGH_1204 [Streptomyces hygroscopicus subsp. jinggangensis TL01]